MKTALVVTSIAAPNAVLKSLAKGAIENNIDFLVIGDTKSPEHFEIDGCHFYPISRQLGLPFKIARNLPVKHYSRKNLGYLLAKDYDVIIETDDDNFPTNEFWKPRTANNFVTHFEHTGWMNVYTHFTPDKIWPRGYPLQFLHSNQVVSGSTKNYYTPIQQGLANENPDVDAVYRMTMKLPFNFKENDPIALGENSWSPFNSQNTTWFKEAFPLMYLPSYCSFRMTDIWRSFVAQRIAWTCNWPIMYHNATVWQERNDHSLVKDFEDEVPGYVNNEKICALLEDLELLSGPANLPENLVRCYRALVEAGFVGKEEMVLVEGWASEF